MVGSYAQASGSLELRQPAKIFVPIAWAIAGPLNPASFFAFQAWGLPFDLVIWLSFVMAPLAVGTGAALYFLHGGGFGLVTLFGITTLVTAAACALAGPIYTVTIWYLQEWGLIQTFLPLGSAMGAFAVSGTFIRAGLVLVGVAIIPAIIILRLVAFQRTPEKKKPRPATNF